MCVFQSAERFVYASSEAEILRASEQEGRVAAHLADGRSRASEEFGHGPPQRSWTIPAHRFTETLKHQRDTQQSEQRHDRVDDFAQEPERVAPMLRMQRTPDGIRHANGSQAKKYGTGGGIEVVGQCEHDQAEG